jgi:NAD-dependent dihydropyrimidine dehydrogenase PreA subunit
MPAKVNEAECTACKSCEDACPTQAIAVDDTNVAKVKEDDCIDCNACADACSAQAITMG